LIPFLDYISNFFNFFNFNRCDRCDNYETINKTAFSAHQDQCLASGEAGESAEGIEGTENDGDAEEGHSGIRSHRKMFECDVCNMKFSNGANMRRHKVSIERLYNKKTYVDITMIHYTFNTESIERSLLIISIFRLILY